ncbi:MAG TPA: serine hydrolase [Actinospica sp.]|jgi:beta-lactamase class A|nr:serine hydrolase [Actinospica sp.]
MVNTGDQQLIRRLRRRLAEAGLTGSFLVRDLASGREIGIDPEVELPIASLVKVPLAVAVLERIRQGGLDGARTIEIRPETYGGRSGVGLTRFRHPAVVAVDDLLYLSLAISDNVASDALFELVPPSEVQQTLTALALTGISVRHSMNELEPSPAEVLDPGQVHLAHLLAIGAGTAGRGHPVAQLDITKANTGTARAFVDLLEALWTTRERRGRRPGIPAEVARRTRELMRGNLIAQRLSPDFASDASIWSSRTGTLLNLRHEVGVVEHEDGAALAVAALTESSVPASSQPAAEALMGEVARALHDRIRADLD